MRLTGRSMTCVIGLTWTLAGCSQSSGLPGAPSSMPVSTPPNAAPDVTKLLPSVGSLSGGATTKIVGTARVDVTFSELPSVERGEFSVISDDGATISGRIVSVSEMAGTISVPSCHAPDVAGKPRERLTAA
jgi:hypothetical protein